MATNRRSSHNTARTLTKAAASATPEAILDIVQRLGLIDLVVDRIRLRLEEVDVDEFLDDIGDYMRRNPEVVVVALGTITVAAGVLVYLTRNEERELVERGEDLEIEVPRHRERETPSRPRAAPNASSGSRRRAAPSE